jgi:uncharacterized repeat protein (TIGR02543 family)
VREVVQGLRNPLEKSKQPSVDPVSPEDDKVTGGGERGAEIIVTWPDGSKTDKIIVGEDSKWTAPVPEGVTLEPGNKIGAIQVEGGKDPSDPTVVEVGPRPPTPPGRETSAKPEINRVGPEDLFLRGSGVSGSKVTIVLPNGLTRVTTVDNGIWEVSLAEALLIGEDLWITQEEDGKDPSITISTTVVGARLTFNPNNGSSSTTRTVNIGRRFGDVSTTPSRSGYTFTGWQNESGQLVPANHEVVGDMVLTAIWQQDNYRGPNPRPQPPGGTTSVPQGPQGDAPVPAPTSDIVFDNVETPQGDGSFEYEPDQPGDNDEYISEYYPSLSPAPLGEFKENPQTGDWSHYSDSENESRAGTIDLTALLGIALAALVLMRRRRAA